MRAAVLILLAATAASAAVREPEVTMTARRLLGAIQITAMIRPGFKFPVNQINMIQVGTATPERPVSVSTREVTFMHPGAANTWTMSLVMTDKNRSRTWPISIRGTWDGKKEDCKVEYIESGPVIPETGIVERPPALPALPDVKDAYKLPPAVKSQRDGKWTDASGPKAGPSLGEPATLGYNAGGGASAGAAARPAAKSKAGAPAEAPAPVQAEPEAKAEEKVEAKAEAKVEAKPGAKVGARPVVQPEAQPEAAPASPGTARSEGARRLIDQIRNRK